MEKKDSVLPTEPSDLTSEPSKTRGRELEKGRSATITAAAPPAVVSADATEGKGRQKRSMTVGTKAAHRPLSQSQTQPTSPLSAQPSGKPSEAGKKESHRSTRHHKDSGRHLRHHSNKKQAKQKATDGGDDGNDANDANNNNSNNHSTVPKKPLITPIEVKLATDVSAEPTNNSNVTTTTTTTVIHAGDIASVADIDSNGWGILIAENVRTWADLKEVLSPEDFAVITSAGSKFDYKKSFEKNQSAMTSPPPKQEEEEEEGKVTQKELSVWLKSKRLPYSMLVERGIVIEGSVTGPLETQKRLWKSDSIAKIDVMLGVSDSGGESKKDGDEGKAWQEPLSARGTSDSRIAPRRRKFTFVGEEMGIKRIMSSKTLKISDPRKQDERRPAERCSKQHIEEDTKKKQTTTTTTTTVKRKEDTKRKSNRKHGNKHKHQSDKKKRNGKEHKASLLGPEGVELRVDLGPEEEEEKEKEEKESAKEENNKPNDKESNVETDLKTPETKPIDENVPEKEKEEEKLNEPTTTKEEEKANESTTKEEANEPTTTKEEEKLNEQTTKEEANEPTTKEEEEANQSTTTKEEELKEDKDNETEKNICEDKDGTAATTTTTTTTEGAAAAATTTATPPTSTTGTASLEVDTKSIEAVVKVFNEKPAKGLMQLQQLGIVGTEAADVAELFYKRGKELGLCGKAIGDFLGSDGCKGYLDAYLKLISFAHMDFDSALRRFLSVFHLPGEGQKIDRVMNSFGERYYEDTKSEYFADKDAVFTLAFFVIMLNTDHYNPSVKKKMTMKEFMTNIRGQNGGHDFDQAFLVVLYEQICSCPLMFPETATFPMAYKRGWLLQELSVMNSKRRWFVLDVDGIRSFRTASPKEAKHFYPLASLSFDAKFDKKRKFVLNALCDGSPEPTKLKVTADNAITYNAWIEILTFLIADNPPLIFPRTPTPAGATPHSATTTPADKCISAPESLANSTTPASTSNSNSNSSRGRTDSKEDICTSSMSSVSASSSGRSSSSSESSSSAFSASSQSRTPKSGSSMCSTSSESRSSKSMSSASSSSNRQSNTSTEASSSPASASPSSAAGTPHSLALPDKQQQPQQLKSVQRKRSQSTTQPQKNGRGRASKSRSRSRSVSVDPDEEKPQHKVRSRFSSTSVAETPLKPAEPGIKITLTTAAKPEEDAGETDEKKKGRSAIPVLLPEEVFATPDLLFTLDEAKAKKLGKVSTFFVIVFNSSLTKVFTFTKGNYRTGLISYIAQSGESAEGSEAEARKFRRKISSFIGCTTPEDAKSVHGSLSLIYSSPSTSPIFGYVLESEDLPFAQQDAGRCWTPCTEVLGNYGIWLVPLTRRNASKIKSWAEKAAKKQK